MKKLRIFTKQGKVLATIIGIITLLSLIVTFSNNPNVPKWEDIFNWCKVPISSEKSSNGSNNDKLYVDFVDVGKADCSYIRYKNYNILIDAGDIDAKEKILNYLEKNKVSKLDMIIVSHPHRDHIGTMPEVINKCAINRFLMFELSESTLPHFRVYSRMESNLKNKNIRIETPKNNSEINFEDIKFKFFTPKEEYKNVNDNSIVTKLTYNNISFLFTGDIQKNREKDMISDAADVQATVIKVPHHGSGTSSSPEFLKVVRPKFAVVPIGPNKNRLPSYKILKQYERSNIKLYRTDECGTVSAVTDGNEITFNTEKVS